ncbi:MAG TPA: CBS domain-containing protein, partial [Candidatus Limnocylindria bacterium]|nr:CBS domain-containing protein [Candidatus Limnocylindria bacterium]
ADQLARARVQQIGLADDPHQRAIGHEAELLLKSYRISGLPVVTDGALVGVISQTDLLNARSSELIGANWDRVRVRHLMTRPAVTVHMNTKALRSARLMLDQHIHRLVVVDDEEVPIGVVTATDMLRLLLPEEAVAPV